MNKRQGSDKTGAKLFFHFWNFLFFFTDELKRDVVMHVLSVTINFQVIFHHNWDCQSARSHSFSTNLFALPFPHVWESSFLGPGKFFGKCFLIPNGLQCGTPQLVYCRFGPPF